MKFESQQPENIESNIHDFKTYMNLGKSFSRAGQLDKAIETYKKARQLEPERHGVYGLLGNVQLKKGNFERAIENYQKSIALNPKQSFGTYENLSNALKMLGKIEEANSIQQKGKKFGSIPKIVPLTEIERIHSQFWKQGYGSISAKEAKFIQDSIFEAKPKRVLEIGTASGLSTGFIAKFMSNLGSGELTSVDLDTHFWVDRTKPTGFLAKEIYTGTEVKLDIFRGKDSTHLPETYSNNKFDLAFIDANHQHPWPVLDMISVLPVLMPRARVIHHDLALYKLQTPVIGIGPKYLHDQISDELKVVTKDSKKNIFYIQTTDRYQELEQALINALYLPWTIRRPISQVAINKFKAIIDNYWSADLMYAFEECLQNFA